MTMPSLTSFENTRADRYAAGMSAFDEVEEDTEAAGLRVAWDLVDAL
jgi:hypothetical protein